MKKRAKRIAVLALTLVLSLSLLGCARKMDCGIYGREGMCKKVEFLGTECMACEDCRAGLEALHEFFR